MSHAYVALCLPFVVLAFILVSKRSDMLGTFKRCAVSGVFAFGLSLWFLVPMVDNSKWNSAFYLTWISQDFWSEAAPPIFYPALGFLVFSILLIPICWRDRWVRKSALLCLVFWLIPSLFYVAAYFIFPTLGLVDVRAIPQIELFICILSGALFSVFLRRLSRLLAWMLTLPLVFAAMWWSDQHVANLPGWLEWNYSGWETKPLRADLKSLSTALKGDFSDPRVAYEHNEISNGSGTSRVFEMIPYFTGRATLESVYLQATIVSPMVFRQQAEISKTPSCPFVQYKCSRHDVQATIPRLKLFGVGDLILITDEVLEQADKVSELEKVGQHGPWYHYRLVEPPKLVEVLEKFPQVTSSSNWRDDFYEWFTEYEEGHEFFIHDFGSTATRNRLHRLKIRHVNSRVSECDPSLEVDFGRLVLRTNCEGKLHLLKFAYNPVWKADSGEPIHMISPGFSAIVPEGKEVVIRFGKSSLWQLSNTGSLLVGVLMLGLFISDRRNQCINV